MKTRLRPWSRVRRSRRARIWCCVGVSSALVGSSAISRRGLAARRRRSPRAALAAESGADRRRASTGIRQAHVEQRCRAAVLGAQVEMHGREPRRSGGRRASPDRGCRRVLEDEADVAARTRRLARPRQSDARRFESQRGSRPARASASVALARTAFADDGEPAHRATEREILESRPGRCRR